MKKLVFVSGIHGSGKGTLCRSLSKISGIKSYSASDLIKNNSDYIEDSKFVDKAEKNQSALLLGISSLKDKKILLDGHFCLLNSNMEIVAIDYAVFDLMNISLVIFVECDPEEIRYRLIKRDNVIFSSDLLRDFQNMELKRARNFCFERDIPFIKYCSGQDDFSIIFKGIEKF
ncbi:ATP-binding protein [Vibrio cholerae]|nr:AAA family ATPase [Vibrio cholerae]EIO5088344.1 AAA family ATPase [Vibrio cholerae]EJB8581346.1 AAA family ATPase [Vibrio cholerae]EJL6522690.1 AAA family ATPase [Vibrio cholerae]EKF9078130.1 AAA family ATPase [Vibrio cholerae]